MKKFLQSFKRTRIGTFTLIAAVLLIIAAVLLNLVLRVIPARYTTMQTGGSPVTSISVRTRDFIRSLDEPVTVYRLIDYNAEYDGLDLSDDQMGIFLSRYTDQNDDLIVVDIDMEEQPDFSADYSADELPHGSLIVESAKRSWVIPGDQLCLYNNDVLDQVFGQSAMLTKTQLLQYMNYVASAYEQGQSYLQQSTTKGYFQGEALLTSAIDYVTADVIPHGYLLTGLDCQPLPERLTNELAKLDVTTLDVTTVSAVPEDADCLILYAPGRDLSASESDMIRRYLNDGGSILLATSYTTVDACPRVMTLLSDRGLSALPGQVRDNDSTHHAGNDGAMLLPDYNPNNLLTYTVGYRGGMAAFMPYCHAIAVSSTLLEGVTAEPLLSTSASARRVSPQDASALSGPGVQFVAASADKAVVRPDGTQKIGRAVWFGSVEAFTDGMALTGNYSGFSYFAYSVQYISSGFTSAYSSIEPVDMSGSSLDGLSAGGAVAWMIILAVVLPLLAAAVGVLMHLNRRKKA